MTRRDADFDEFCDPDKPREIKIDDVLTAADSLRSHIIYTPCRLSHSQKEFAMELYYKLETLQQTGSFKERGVLNALKLLPPEKRQQGVVLASLGNAAVAISHHGAKLGIPVVVVMPRTVPIVTLEKCYSLGAKVIVQGWNLMDAQKHARSIARAEGATYINGRDHPNILSGYGTVALEILQQMPLVNAVIVPVGCGGLAAAVATVIKHIKPKCLVYGVQAENMPVFFKSLENGAPTIIPMKSTAAHEIAVPHIGVNSFYNAKSHLDKMLIVNEDWISRAMLHLVEEERLVVEAAGACSLATVIGQLVPELKNKNVVCILSGGNVDNTLFVRTLDRGLTAEGRLMKFTVVMPDSSGSQAKLLKLLESEGYNVVTQFQEHRWLDDDTYNQLEEDFDEFCDPENPKILKIEDVMNAAEQLKPYIVNTPCVPSHHQKELVIRLYYKLETVQKSGSFKERGILYALQQLPTDKKKLGVVIASLGNAAIALCQHASKLGIPVIVVMPTCVSVTNVQRCYALGAKVIEQGGHLAESQKYARAIARDKGLTYINGRDHPHLLAGYGTLALEILDQVPLVDAVIVPVGCGGLAAAVATVIKHIKPRCLVYGVQSESMTAFYQSLVNAEMTTVPIQPTLADGIAMTNVGVNSFSIAQQLIDKMVLVNDTSIARAMLYLAEKERFVVEGAAACSLAAIIGNLVPELKTKHVVCILSGGNVDPIVYARCLDRGLSAEGRLVKFRVQINDKSEAQAQLMKLLAKGGYNVVWQFQEHRWLEDEIYRLEIKLVCQAKTLAHALELKRIMERAYPCTVFETEPFNDKRTCPCYIRKSLTKYA